MHGNGGDTFQIIRFDLINCFFKCWLSIEFFYFMSVFDTKLTKIIVTGCSNFSNKEFWWNLDYYFIDHFGNFWEAWCFLVYSNHFLGEVNSLYSFRYLQIHYYKHLFNILWSLMLLFYKIHQFFFRLLKNLIVLIKLGLVFCLKASFENLIFRIERGHFIFNVFWWELVRFHMLLSLEIYKLFFWLFKTLIIFVKLGL